MSASKDSTGKVCPKPLRVNNITEQSLITYAPQFYIDFQNQQGKLFCIDNPECLED